MNAYTNSNKMFIYSIEMFIGFTQRIQTVSESQAPENSDRFYTLLDVRAKIISEKDFVVNFIVLESGPNTEVEATNLLLGPPDALFGTREDASSDISHTRSLGILNDILKTPLFAVIIDDFRIENLEFFTIEIAIPDYPGYRDNFECTTDEKVPPPGGFFCRHTVYIVDDMVSLLLSTKIGVDTFLSFSELFHVAFVKTMYTVMESERRVEVCVNLTYPEVDLLEETVQVNVFHYDSSHPTRF